MRKRVKQPKDTSLFGKKRRAKSSFCKMGEGVDPAAQVLAEYIYVLALQKGSKDKHHLRSIHLHRIPRKS